MTRADIFSFTQYILSQNTYFDKGFALAYKDDKQRVFAYDISGDLKAVMPMDNIGNYFYLRTDGKITHTIREAERVSDHGATRQVFTNSGTIYCVCMLRDADEFILIDNIRNTCASFTGMICIVQESIIIRELIVQTEMAGADKKDIENALSKLKGFTMVSVKISVNKNTVSQECITNPCTC